MTGQRRGFITSSGLLCDQYELGMQRLDYNRRDVDMFTSDSQEQWERRFLGFKGLKQLSRFVSYSTSGRCDCTM